MVSWKSGFIEHLQKRPCFESNKGLQITVILEGEVIFGEGFGIIHLDNSFSENELVPRCRLLSNSDRGFNFELVRIFNHI